MNRSPLNRSQRPIKQKGSRSLAWENCRAEKVTSDVDDEGLIRCEDWKMGMDRCGIAREPSAMDLHHKLGRDGKLLTDKSHLVWLTRECHEVAHG